jgi:glycosyltransferase involved in cell wall biosynthesis
MAAESSSTRVAVVIPTHNCAPYLARALDSVFAQTYRNLYVVVVDDGSTDNTDGVLRGYGERGIFLKQPHSGPGAARNRGIRASDGTYIAFLDADDVWLPTKLERQIELLERQPHLDLVCSDFSLRGGLAPTQSYLNGLRLHADALVFERLLRNCPVCTSTVVIRRRCLDDVGLFNESLTVSEDLNLWLRIASRCELALIPEVLVTKYARNENLSSATSLERKLSDIVTALEDLILSCPAMSQHQRSEIDTVLADRYYDYGSQLLSSRATRAGRRELAAALRYRKLHWRAMAKLGGSFLPATAFGFLVRLLRPSLRRAAGNASQP